MYPDLLFNKKETMHNRKHFWRKGCIVRSLCAIQFPNLITLLHINTPVAPALLCCSSENPSLYVIVLEKKKENLHYFSADK